MVISINRPARTRGWRWSSCRIRLTRFTTGTNGSLPSVMPPTPSRESLTRAAASHGWSTIIHGSALTSGRPFWDGSRKRPDVYQRVLDADRESREQFHGHGSALAQVYNHIIMPLANRADKKTQVAWGVRDFRHRFGREPEGVWLAETAVDLPTLEVLAEYGRGSRAGPEPGAPRSPGRVEGMDRRERRAHRSFGLLRAETGIGPVDRHLLLRWARVASGCV